MLNSTKTHKANSGARKTWLTTEEVANYLGRSPNAIRILVSRGLLIKRKWGRRLYFKRTEIDLLLDTAQI